MSGTDNTPKGEPKNPGYRQRLNACLVEAAHQNGPAGATVLSSSTVNGVTTVEAKGPDSGSLLNDLKISTDGSHVNIDASGSVNFLRRWDGESPSASVVADVTPSGLGHGVISGGISANDARANAVAGTVADVNACMKKKSFKPDGP